MDPKKQKQSAKLFAENWKGRGYEKGDAQVFWTELLQQVCGMQSVSSKVSFERRAANGGFIDCLIPDSRVIIEQKGLGIDLDKPEERQGRMVTPFEQAFDYARGFKHDQQPLFIVVCNFETFRVHNRNTSSDDDLAQNYIEFTLEELGENPSLLGFITDPENSRAEKERQVSMRAGAQIGELFEMLRGQYIDPDSPESSHSLNVLCVRLVFCLFCEDADLFTKDALLNYLRNVPPENIRRALRELFIALNTPEEERDPYDREKFSGFPYVNGGLFAEDVEIPNFTEDIKFKLLFDASQNTDWSKISPTIFGGIFESTLNPETRRAGGMHYTSPENIHKVIDPLFLDALHDEFDSIKADTALAGKKRKRALRAFRNKIASMRFVDPACGSGNFLTETYLCLRRLENEVLNELNDGQTELLLGDEDPQTSIRVSLDQLYGIEINDFACRVAKTALWIAHLQANRECEMLLDIDLQDFPLTDSANIVNVNALRYDWNELLPAKDCDYVMGNPPFYGHQWRTGEQQEDMDIAFAGWSKYGKLDYVCAWYAKASEYINGSEICCAFVSTNSICQGESVAILWGQLADRGIHIDFAYPTFVWNSEANDVAHVHVVIVGFSGPNSQKANKRIFYADEAKDVSHINGYLVDAPDVYIASRGKPLNDGAPEMTKGSQPTDGGHLILSPEERNELVSKYPNLKNVIRRYMGGREFINNIERYCLWFKDANLADYNYPEIRIRLEGVAESRSSSPTASVREAASTPALFTQIRQPDSSYLAVPKVSSSRRNYIPVGYIDQCVIASDQLNFLPTSSLFVFGLLSSKAHMSWVKTVSGRMKSDYRYSPAVWNSFIFPDASEDQRQSIRDLAQSVLDARAIYPEASLADLYDPDNEFFYPELFKAHKDLDAAVEDAYGVNFHGDEEKIVAHLFKLYAEIACEKNLN